MDLKEKVINKADLIAEVLENKYDVMIKKTQDNDIKIMCIKPINAKPKDSYNN